MIEMGGEMKQVYGALAPSAAVSQAASLPCYESAHLLTKETDKTFWKVASVSLRHRFIYNREALVRVQA
jgi:hypothetical protein